MVYFFAGVNGVGKTTIITEIIKRDSRFRLFKGSSELMKRVGLNEGDYEALRSLPDEYKEAQVDAMMEEVLSKFMDSESILIVDAHLIKALA